MRLSKICSVRTGYTFRGKVVHDPSGNLRVVQPKDIVNKEISSERTFIDSTNINVLENHLLRDGEVLIANKGTKFATAVYRESSERCIASASFFILSLKQSLILPEYLIWFLDQDAAREHLISRAITTTIPSINKSVIEDLIVSLPSLETQSYIVELLKNSTQELNIMKQLITKKSEFYNSYIWEKINSEIGE